MIINTQFHKTSFARVLCFILMKVIGRWLPWMQPGSTGRFSITILCTDTTKYVYSFFFFISETLYWTRSWGSIRWFDSLERFGCRYNLQLQIIDSAETGIDSIALSPRFTALPTWLGMHATYCNLWHLYKKKTVLNEGRTGCYTKIGIKRTVILNFVQMTPLPTKETQPEI